MVIESFKNASIAGIFVTIDGLVFYISLALLFLVTGNKCGTWIKYLG
jgi:hypothetical protein